MNKKLFLAVCFCVFLCKMSFATEGADYIIESEFSKSAESQNADLNATTDAIDPSETHFSENTESQDADQATTDGMIQTNTARNKSEEGERPLPCLAAVTARHIDPGGVGYNHGYTTLEGLFFPLHSSSYFYPFLDARLHYFNNNDFAANGGAGVRYGAFQNKVLFGLNTYFDYRTNHTYLLHFTQMGCGFEALSKVLDFRVNGYFPLRTRESIKKCVFDQFIGDFFMMRRKVKVALTGVDAEVGRFITQTHWVRLYGAVGSYYYGGNVCRHTVGGRVRLRMDISDYVFIDGIVTHDSIYKTRVQGQFGLTFSLGCSPKKRRQQRRLGQPVQRHEIIVLDEYCTWKTNF